MKKCDKFNDWALFFRIEYTVNERSREEGNF